MQGAFAAGAATAGSAGAAAAVPRGKSAATAAHAAAPGGASAVDPSPMDDSLSEQPADEAVAARARKMAAAKAAAAAACAQMAAAAKGPYSKMHSCDQVVLLHDWEMWDTIAVNWCKPGKESIHEIVDTWEGRDLAACVFKLGLPVLYAKKHYVQHMRRSVIDAALAHARAHPELFESGAAGQSGPESGSEQPSPRAAPLSRPAVRAASAAANAAPPLRSAQMRSAAAAAVAALEDFAPDSEEEAPASAQNSRLPGKHVLPSPARSARRSSVAVSPLRHARRPLPNLHSLGGYVTPPSLQSSGDNSDDSESDWLPSSEASDRQMREDVRHQLARAGIQSDFATGFVANAKFEAGGRTMYQLYKDVTSTFTLESARRECLALSRILDALLRGDTATALEHTCRRLGGVHTAAETGNWAMCERLETQSQQRSFVPDAFMRSALKSVVQMQAVKKSAAEGFVGKGARSKGASASGREERRSSAKPYKKGSAKDSRDSTTSGAGASHKKKAAGSDS
jgi:hypothetical protein